MAALEDMVNNFDPDVFDKFEYNGLVFTVYKEYDFRIDQMCYTVIARHAHYPMHLRTYVYEYITREELEKNPVTSFPENLKEGLYIDVLWDLVEAYSLMHGANTNRYQWYTHFKDHPKDKEPWQFKGNEFWPVITKESVAKYYERNDIKPYLNFDGTEAEPSDQS
ncbi:hypothetical protein PBI_PEREGRIN_258 [Rhodococcus phage Peregrin]|nr:hypothetical protein PBI_PEREGRIN_258 [Rhodococcus phage Peregrin]